MENINFKAEKRALLKRNQKIKDLFTPGAITDDFYSASLLLYDGSLIRKHAGNGKGDFDKYVIDEAYPDKDLPELQDMFGFIILVPKQHVAQAHSRQPISQTQKDVLFDSGYHLINW